RATQYLTSSDIRLKEDVTPLTGALERLEKVRGVSFEWNEQAKSMGHSSDRREIENQGARHRPGTLVPDEDKRDRDMDPAPGDPSDHPALIHGNVAKRTS